MLLLTIPQLADQLQVKTGTVYAWVSKKKVPFVKVHRAVRFNQAEIDKWLTKRSVKTTIGGMVA